MGSENNNKNTGFDDFELTDPNIPTKNDITIVGEVDSQTQLHKVADFGKIAFENNAILVLLSGNSSDRELAKAIIKSRTVREVVITNNIMLLAGKRGSGKTSHNNAFITVCVSETDPDYKAEDELFDLLRYGPPAQVADLRRAVNNPNFTPGYFHYLEKALSTGLVYETKKKGENSYNVLTLSRGTDLFIAHAEVIKELIDSLTAKNNNIKTLSAVHERTENGIIIPVTLYTESRDGIYENSTFYTDIQIKGYGDSMDIVFSVNRLHAMVDDVTEPEIERIIDEIKSYVHTLKANMLKRIMSEAEFKKMDIYGAKLADLFKVSVIVQNGFTAQVRVSFHFPYESILIVAGCNRALKVVSYDENMPMGSYIDTSRDDRSTILKGGLSKIILYKPSTMSLLMSSIGCTLALELRDDGDNKELFMGINADVIYFSYDGYNTVIDQERFRSRFVTKNNLIANGSLYRNVFNTFHQTVLSTNFINDIVNSTKIKTNKNKSDLIAKLTLLASDLLKDTNAYVQHINFNKNIIDIIGLTSGSTSSSFRTKSHKDLLDTSATLITSIVSKRRQLEREGSGNGVN